MIPNPVRWAFAAIAAAGAFFAGVYAYVLAVLFAPLPRDVTEPAAGFLLVALVTLAGSITAPRWRFGTAAILAALALAMGVMVLDVHVVGAGIGALATVAFVGWWTRPHRTRLATARVAVAASAAVLAFAAYGYARYVDRPARADELPPEVVSALGPDAARITAFYRYDLGGFIDHEWLWRIDADREVVARLARGLGLGPGAVPPRRFWRMPPHYWPRAMPSGGVALQSPEFRAEERGPDGEHYFLVHDPARDRAFVWVKSNF